MSEEKEKFPTIRPLEGKKVIINSQGDAYIGIAVETNCGIGVEIKEKITQGPLHVGYILDSNHVFYWEYY